MRQSIERANTGRFSLRFYFSALTRMLGSPGQFFKEFPGEIGYGQPLGFLIISSLFFVGASLIQVPERPFITAGILLINAVGMAFITAGVIFMIMTMLVGRRVPFPRIFAVYAFSSGVTLLVAWIPLLVWITEPWKWALVSIGMVRGCGLKWVQAILLIGASILILILLFWSVTPVILYIRQLR